MNRTMNPHLTTPDILRGFAILIVVVFHVFIKAYGVALPWGDWLWGISPPPSPYFVLLYPLSLGWTGVALFFVLSGFCIHFSFLRSSAAFTWQRFLWQRVWRIYPAYFASLLVFTFWRNLDLHSFLGARQFVVHALLLQNVSLNYMFEINPAFWSLATEMQLYLLFPVLILLRRKWGIEGCLVVTGLVGLAWRVVATHYWGWGFTVKPAMACPLGTWFDWTLGAYVAERTYQQRSAFSRHRLWLAVLVPTFFLSTFLVIFDAYTFVLASAISAVVLDALLKVTWRKSIFLTAAVGTGTISYSLYLWHQPLLYLDFSHLFPDWNGLQKWAVIFGIITIFTLFSWYFIERTSIRIGKILGKRIFDA